MSKGGKSSKIDETWGSITGSIKIKIRWGILKLKLDEW